MVFAPPSGRLPSFKTAAAQVLGQIRKYSVHFEFMLPDGTLTYLS